VKASAWKWVAIAFIVLFAIVALFAVMFYYGYNAVSSSLQSCESSSSGWVSVVNLENTTTLVNDQTVSEPAGSTYDFNFNIQYAGYIEVEVSSSTTSNTYVEVYGVYNDWPYSSGWISVGSGGTVYFPVVPGTVTVYIGNTNSFSGATQTVSVVYYY
jgi:hypothetical protein